MLTWSPWRRGRSRRGERAREAPPWRVRALRTGCAGEVVDEMSRRAGGGAAEAPGNGQGRRPGDDSELTGPLLRLPSLLRFGMLLLVLVLVLSERGRL